MFINVLSQITDTDISIIWDIKNWINWIIGGILSAIIGSIWKLIKLPQINANPLAIVKLKNRRNVNVIGFIFTYLIPLSVIVYVFIENKVENNFRNILLFILIFFIFFVNIVLDVIMPQILKIYELMIIKTKTDSEKLKNIDDCFTKVYDHIESIKNNQN